MSADELAEERRALDERLEIVASGSTLSARAAFRGFVVLVALLLLILGGLIGITLDTNVAVSDRSVLEQRNADLEEENADLESNLNETLAALLESRDILRANGIEPPDVTIGVEPPEPPGG